MTKMFLQIFILQVYFSALENTDFPNPNYQSEKLQKGRFISLLVYSANMKLEIAVQSVLLLEVKIYSQKLLLSKERPLSVRLRVCLM